MIVEVLKSCWTYESAKSKLKELPCSKEAFKNWRFVQLATAVHGDKYDYSNICVGTKTDKVKITCPLHGEFEQSPKDHITRMSGCKKCANRFTTEDFISRALVVHGDLYDYSKVQYTSALDTVTIICKIHGEFEQRAASHLRGHHCIKCTGISKNTTETFIEQAKTVHLDKYSYDNSNYGNNNKDKVSVTCNTCNTDFLVNPNNHVSKESGCPKCSAASNESKGELELREFIVGLGFETEKYILSDRKHIDILVPELNVGFEFNGEYWHSYPKKSKTYHLEKTLQAKEEGIELIHVWSIDWQHKKHIVKSMVRSKLGLSNKLYARNFMLVELEYQEGSQFIETNHIQGNAKSANKYLGLKNKYTQELVMVASFGSPRFGNTDLELLRVCTKLGHTVVGGFSKLISSIKEPLVSYCRLDYSNGNVYSKLGFKLIKSTEPDYWYCINYTKVSRYQAMKHKLSTLLGSGFDPDITEEQNMLNNGFSKIYGCGNLVFRKEGK